MNDSLIGRCSCCNEDGLYLPCHVLGVGAVCDPCATRGLGTGRCLHPIKDYPAIKEGTSRVNP